MSFKIRKSGAWANTGTVNVRKSGAWATAGFVKAMKSGSWALVWPSLLASLTATGVFASGASAGGAAAFYKVDNDGSAYTKIGVGSYTSFETWLDAGTNSNFEVRFIETVNNGIGTTGGSALNTWLGLATGREINVGGAGPGDIAYREFSVDIRETVTNTILTTATITLSAERV